MKIKISLAGVIACLSVMVTSVPVQAQWHKLQLDLNYTVGIPSGSFRHDAVNKTSFLGWTANLLYNISDHLSAGAGVGYQDFYQKYSRAVYELPEGGEVSAVLTNSIQVIPILAQARYQFLPRRMIQPYMGVGIGGNIIMFDQYLGEFDNPQTEFKFAVRPTAGLFIPFRKNIPTGVHVFGAYNYMPYNENGIDNLSNWSAGVGIKFPLR